MSRVRIVVTLGLAVGLIAAVLPSGAVGASAVAASSSVNKGALNGIYRITWTKKQLIAAGAAADFAASNTLTLTLRDGQFRFQIKEEPALSCRGAYSLYSLNGTKRFSISMYNATKCPEINASFAAIWTRPAATSASRS